MCEWCGFWRMRGWTREEEAGPAGSFVSMSSKNVSVIVQ